MRQKTLTPNWPPARSDVVLAAAVAVVVVVGTLIVAEESPGDRPEWLGYLMLVLASAALLIRRTLPVATVVLVMVVSLAYHALNFAGGAFTIPPGVALYSAVSFGHRGTALIGAAVYFVGVFTLGNLWGRTPDTQGTVWFVTWLVVILVVGEVSRGRQAHLLAIRERALQAEQTREYEARRRANEERLRIARELHDVLAHNISMINIQAGVAAHLMDRKPEQVRTALVEITRASKQILSELRITLGILRQVDDEEYPLSPTPGMDRLEELVAAARHAGLEVEMALLGEIAELPAAVDLAVYRIVQESLTNAIRHSQARRARITLSLTHGDLVIEVDDDGVGLASDRLLDQGNGMLGMRERATAAGGEFHAGTSPTGGFLVRARLPIGGEAA